MNFRSDNEAPIHQEILNAIIEANAGFEESYGYDKFSDHFTEQCQQLFQCWCEVLPLTTGTAANSIAMTLACPPYGSILCHEHAHLNADECGAPEFFTGGAKLIPIKGDHGKIDLNALDNYLSHTGVHGEHESLPSVISITQCSEAGTVYSLAELEQLKAIKQKYNLTLHMDGARFANALCSLGCDVAEMTWKSGIDMLSFGATKNGAMMAEALIVFNPHLTKEIKRLRKRSGHLISKMRFVSAQLNAYLKDDLWLKMAQHANDMAQHFHQTTNAKVKFIHPVEANEVFCQLPVTVIEQLRIEGFEFHVWPGSTDIIRLVFSHATNAEDVNRLAQSIMQQID
ncbi:low specificity L-threonine aldolase [Marinicella sp. S1101]|uniref:threonine aldolase family protein n=1 Tax=Marinicella marina TaxID=2996016 RepID=UPI002260C371|nr:low specificity L-threonine aldolase [Marinicella marina]MCX7554670.1 low specificity L-threonine aldolase [Marinicella marina]MDJ1140735.1 low specificity L-threonine aldolase [Marinicella marina]